jgi:hypothetical protein
MHRWLQHDEYRHLAMAPTETNPIATTTIEPLNPGSLALVRSLFDELLPNFSSRHYVNVGLDEPWELPPARIDDYLDWVRVLRALPELDGREMLIWGDVLGGEPDRIRALPERVTVCEWGYDAGHPFASRAATYEECGTPFWVAPGTSSWLTLLGRTTNMRANCAEAVDAAVAHGGGGMLNTDWGDSATCSTCRSASPDCARRGRGLVRRQQPRPGSRGGALRALLRRSTGALGETLVELGDLYLTLTPQMGNIVHRSCSTSTGPTSSPGGGRSKA